MNTTHLFGEPPGRADVAPPPTAEDEPPKSAASLFGAEIEGDALAGSLQSKVVPIQDIPDDLFGNSGGNGSGGDGGVGVTSGFDAPPSAARSPRFPSSFNLQGVPDGMFDEAGNTGNTGASFGFGAAVEPPGFVETCGYGGDSNPVSFPPPRDDASGRKPSPVNNYIFGAPPPPRGDEAIAALMEGTQTRSGTADFVAPPNDELFGAPPSEATAWWGASPPGKQLYSSDERAERMFRFNETSTTSATDAAPSNQIRAMPPPPPPVSDSGGNPDHVTISSNSPMSRSASIPAGCVFGAPPSVAPIGAFPANVSEAPRPSASPPDSGNAFHAQRPRVRTSGSPSPPLAQAFDREPTRPWPHATNRSESPHWNTQHQKTIHEGLVRGVHHGGDAQSSDSPPVAHSWAAESHSPPLVAASSTNEPNRSAPEAMSGRSPPTDGAFVGSPQVTPGEGVGDNSPEEAFGPPNEADSASIVNSFGEIPGVDDVSNADAVFVSSDGNGIFRQGGSGEWGQTSSPPLPPFEAPGALTARGPESSQNRATASIADDRQWTWPGEQRDVSGFVAPLEDPPQNVFRFEAEDDEEESTPWWQMDTQNDEQVGTAGMESPLSPSGNVTHSGFSEKVTPDGIFHPHPDTSTQKIPQAHCTSGETAARNESRGLGAPSAAVFGTPGENIGETGMKQVQPLKALPRSTHEKPAAVFRTPGENIGETGIKQPQPLEALPRSTPEEPGKKSNTAASAVHASLTIGENAPTGVVKEQDPMNLYASPDFGKPEAGQLTEGMESPGWKKQPAATLKLGFHGASPGGLFATTGKDPFGALGDAAELSQQDGGGFKDWGMCTADPVAVAEPEMSGGAADTSRTRVTPPRQEVVTGAPPRTEKPFDEESDSSSIIAQKQRGHGAREVTVSSPKKETKGERDAATGAPVQKPFPGHRWTRPGLNTAAMQRAMGSSFRVSDSSTATIYEVDAPLDSDDASPSSPPRLFATRSGSWVDDEPTTLSMTDFKMFSKAYGKSSRPPRVETIAIPLSNPEIATAAPDSTARSSPGESAIKRTTGVSAAGVKASSRRKGSQRDKEGSDGVPQSAPDAPADTPETRGAVRSSFRRGDAVTLTAAAALGITPPVDADAAPSSPRRLFASRSSSWAVRETTLESKTDFSNMFSKPRVRHGVRRIENDDPLSAPAISATVPDSILHGGSSGSAVGRTTKASAIGVELNSWRNESQLETKGFAHKKAVSRSGPPGWGELTLGAGHVHGRVVESDAAENSTNDAKVSRAGKADGKEDELHPGWGRNSSSTSPSGLAAAVEKKVDARRVVGADEGWDATDDWVGDDGAKPKDAKKSREPEARKEDADDAEQGEEGQRDQGPSNQVEGDRSRVGEDGGGLQVCPNDQDRESGDRSGNETEEGDGDEMDDDLEWSDGGDDDDDVSAAEKTACDFFASSASPSGAGPESPRPNARSDSSRASFASLSPLSEYGLISRRERKDGEERAREAPRCLNTLGSALASSYRKNLADLPPMFPPTGFYRVRPANLGGLPPPVAAYYLSASSAARPTWRSLSPSRALEDVKGNGEGSSVSVLRSGPTGSRKDARAHSFSPARAQKIGLVSDPIGMETAEQGPALLSLPPSQAPKRSFGRPGNLEDVALLGQAKTNLSSTMFWQNRTETEKIGQTASENHSLDTAASPQYQIQGSSQRAGGDPNEDSLVVTREISPSSAKLSKSQSSSLGEDADDSPNVVFSSNQDASTNPEDGPGVVVSSRHATAHDDSAGAEPLAPEEPSPAASLPKDPRDSGASGATWQTSPISLPTNPGSNAERTKDMSEANPTTVEAQPPPSRSVLEFGTIKELDRDCPELDQKDRPRAAPTLYSSSDLRGKTVVDLVVSSHPSTSSFVNTYPPLTRTRNEQSLSDPGKAALADGEAGGTKNDAEGAAAHLFAAEAPSSSGDELFAAQRPETPAGAGHPFEVNAEGSRGVFDPFSRGPPPEAPGIPSQSLPNPWGTSAPKQPLVEPKCWPTTGGSGFDRPPLPTPSSTEEPPGCPVASTIVEAGVGVPAAFANTLSQGPGRSLGTGTRKYTEAGGSAFRPAPASFLPPFAARDSSEKMGVVARPWEGSRKGTPAGVEGIGGTPMFRANDPFSASSRTPAMVAIAPAVVKTSLHRSGASFGSRSGGSGNWGSAAAAGAAATATVVSDKAPRDPSVRPPGALAVFGFGGKLVSIYPRRKIRLAPAPGVVPPPDDGLNLRSGPIIMWSLKDLAEPGRVVKDPEAFPGPASSAPLDKLKEYVDGRANGVDEGERLLWSVAGLALQFKGCLSSDERGATDARSPEAALVSLLKAAHARRKEAARNVTPTLSPLPTPMSPATRGHAPWRAAPRPHSSTPGGARDAQLAFPGAGAGTPQGPLLRPGGSGHRTVDSGGGGGSAPPGVTSVGVGPFGGVPGGGSVHGGGRAGPVEVASVTRAEGTGTGSQEEVEALLVDGKKEEAVDASIRAGLWGLALLIAAQCPAASASGGEDKAAPLQTPYQRAVRLYANAFLQSGTPLHTMALAFSGQAEAAIKHGGKSLGGPMGDGGSRGQGGFKESWTATAAAIVSNKVPGWSEQLIGLGDRLVESDEVPAAHALFLMAGMQAELPTTKGARLVLPGVDHRKLAHRALRTMEATDAVHILEILDVAWKGNRGRNSDAVLGHKLRLAMRLADAGFLPKAYQYVRNTQAEVTSMGGRSEKGTQQRSPFSPQFIAALKDFEDRLCVALGTGVAAKADKKERTAGSAVAGTGGWLLNRVTSLVKSSATPGPLPPGPRASSPGAQPNVTAEDASRLALQSEPRTNAFPQQQEQYQALPQEVAGGGKVGSSHLAGAGSVPAMAPSTMALGQQPFGQSDVPRPPGVQAGRPPTWAGVKNKPQSRSRPNPPATEYAPRQGTPGDNRGGETGSMAPSPPNTFTGDTSPPLGFGAGQVAENILNDGEGNRSVTSKGMPHVSSAPTLSGGLQGDDQASLPEEKETGRKVGNGEERNTSRKGGEPTSEAVGSEAGQPPKSEPRKREKDNKGNQSRRTNATSAVGTKPGVVAKMLAKWLYPDAKHADVGNEMKAYYDEKTKRWVFPGEDPGEAVAAAPSAPPTVAQLSAPSISAPQPPPVSDANDPLAALMAPPPATFGGPRKLALPGTTQGGGPPTTGGGLREVGGPPSGGLGWASMAAPPMSSWGAPGGTVKSPFPGGGKFTVLTPKAPAAASNAVDRGASGSEGGGSIDD